MKIYNDFAREVMEEFTDVSRRVVFMLVPLQMFIMQQLFIM